MSVIGAVEPTLRKAEVERARRKRPDNLDAYDLFLRALPFAATAMPEDGRQGRRASWRRRSAGTGLCHRPWGVSPGVTSSAILAMVDLRWQKRSPGRPDP